MTEHTLPTALTSAEPARRSIKGFGMTTIVVTGGSAGIGLAAAEQMRQVPNWAAADVGAQAEAKPLM